LKLHHTPALPFNRDPPQSDEQRVKKRETTRRKISRKKIKNWETIQFKNSKRKKEKIVFLNKTENKIKKKKTKRCE
jgi:hypothetical protein